MHARLVGLQTYYNTRDHATAPLARLSAKLCPAPPQASHALSAPLRALPPTFPPRSSDLDLLDLDLSSLHNALDYAAADGTFGRARARALALELVGILLAEALVAARYEHHLGHGLLAHDTGRWRQLLELGVNSLG